MKKTGEGVGEEWGGGEGSVGCEPIIECIVKFRKTVGGR